MKGVEKAKFRSGYKLTTGGLEDALFQWVTTARENKITLNNEVIQEKARQLAEQNPEWAISDEFKFSYGWLHRFKQRCGLKLMKLHGEAATVDPNAIQEASNL